jgi:acetyl esterase/lipase
MRTGWKKFPLALLALFLVAATKTEQMPPMEDYGAKAEIVIKNVSYMPGHEKDEDFLLDIYSNPHEGLWPVVVVIHGGGWVNGTKENHNKVYNAKHLAADGYVVFNINYRLLPEARLKKQAEDCMAAVIWVKLHAKEYGGDPERVGVLGGSAGGHLGALVAWASDDPWFVPTGNPQGPDSFVKVAALYYPVIDLELTFREQGKWLGPAALSLIVTRRFETYQESLHHLSPMYHVKANDPPTIFLTGDADELNLYPQSVQYSQALRDLGVDSEVYTAPGKKHAFTGQYWEPEAQESARRVTAFFDKYLK